MCNETIVKTILKFYPSTEAIYVFGSYGTPHEKAESDVDIAVLFPAGRAGAIGNLVGSECRYALEEALKKTVELINLENANTVFQQEIIQEGVLIYRQDECAVDVFEMRVMSSYQKLNEERAGILEDILETGRILQ